jgi:hypothetical protein
VLLGSRGLSQPLIANIQGLKELGEGEEVDREVSPPILNIEENEQQDNLHEVNRELGNPPDTSAAVSTTACNACLVPLLGP